jgi:hypothetical protein
MPFSPLVEIQLSSEWQVTPLTDANFFRFVYRANVGFSYLVVAQAQEGGDGLELYRSFRLALTGQGVDIADLEIPPVFNPGQRRLAVRGLGPARSQTPKSLNLLIEATKIMIINPTGGVVTTKEKKTDFLQSDNSNREMVPANPDRNGGIIFNKGNKSLWIGLGVNAEKSSPNKVLPGGQMEIPAGFTGVINGIFDAADTTPNNTSKAIVEEMVAG